MAKRTKRGKGLSFYVKEKKINAKKLKEWSGVGIWCLIAIFFAFVIVLLFGMRVGVIGNSMEPVLYNGQEVFISKASYIMLNPKRGDIIAFKPNGNDKNHVYVKRVVGLPGESVLIKNGRVYIDGALYEEQGVDKIEDPGLAKDAFVLGEKEYFVLGDNRNNSEDSRSGNVGAVKKDYIIGKVWFHFAKGDHKMGFN